jgi:glycosyltransferase involved in cell wall biosynthesis
MSAVQLDILIPVYNEGDNILQVVENLRQSVTTAFQISICYDHEEDTTLSALKTYQHLDKVNLSLIRNQTQGVLGAILTGLSKTTAPAILIFPADDTYNAGIIDNMVQKFKAGCEVVCASRFMPGGTMKGCPWLKSVLVRTASFTLHHLACLPTHDATNGFRLFSRRVLEQFTIETPQGWAFSLELLVKTHRQGGKIGEVPAQWHERTRGQSRFRVLKWAPFYLRWYFYALATTYLLK